MDTKGLDECNVPTTSKTDNRPSLRYRAPKCMSDRYQLIKTQNVFGSSPHSLLSALLPRWHATQCQPIQNWPLNYQASRQLLGLLLSDFPRLADSEWPAMRSLSVSSLLTLSNVKTSFKVQVEGWEMFGITQLSQFVHLCTIQSHFVVYTVYCKYIHTENSKKKTAHHISQNFCNSAFTILIWSMNFK